MARREQYDSDEEYESRSRDVSESPTGAILELSRELSDNALKLARLASKKHPQLTSALKSSSFSSVSNEEILSRANVIQKALKGNPRSFPRAKPKDGDEKGDQVVISVCEMINTRSGYRQRPSTVIEINKARRSDDYFTFASKAASALSLKRPPKSLLRVFKVSRGAVIQNEPIPFHGDVREWSLGNYLALLKKSASAIKIGVGYIDDPDEISSCSSEETASVVTSNKRSRPLHDCSGTDTAVSKKFKSSSPSFTSGLGTALSPFVISSAVHDCTGSTSLPNCHVQQFSDIVINEATNNFSSELKLGAGGFGEVYKGCLNGTFVAVKRLYTVRPRAGSSGIVKWDTKNTIAKQDVWIQLNTEFKALTKCRHKNLLELMGYCISPPMLVYEYMEKGSLYALLYHSTTPLTWIQRSKSMKDVSRGLLWLHSATPPMLHGDIKASNVLVDSHFTSKLGDFGFTKEMAASTSDTVVLKTAIEIARTAGYSAPEFDFSRHSVKSDVYSYGVLVLETFTNQKPLDTKREDALLVHHLEENLRDTDSLQDVACSEAGEIAPYLLQLYIKVIKNCLKKHSIRPTSKTVMDWWNETNF